MAMPAVTQQSPAAKPAPMPSIRAGLGPRNMANTADWISDRTKAPPNITALLPLRMASSLTPAAAAQGLANSAEYQSPPSTKLESAAASTANQFTCGIE